MNRPSADPARRRLGVRLGSLFDTLYRAYGPQGWWPARSRFEMAAGAVLVQNTAWSGAARAIDRLRREQALEPAALLRIPPARLAGWLRPAGTFRLKARRLRILSQWLLAQGGFRRLARWPTGRLRAALLAVEGIGPETADDILLYAFRRPVFVVDAYTRRLLQRLGWVEAAGRYETLRDRIEASLRPDEPMCNEFHALIVRFGQEVCRRRPRCAACPLRRRCRTGRQAGAAGGSPARVG